MTIKVTFSELNQRGWKKACAVLGLDYYCMNDGRATGETKVTLTEEQAKQLNFLPHD